MSNFKMSLVVLCVASATLAYSASARAQPFEGCGVLYLTHPEECLAFLPDSGEFPGGLLGDWGGFQDGDRVFVSGVVEVPKCGTFCNVDGCFLDGNTVDVCPAIPTVSEWGMIALGVLVLVAGTVVIRNRKRVCSSAGVLGVVFLLVLCASSFAQDPLVAQKVDRMLQSQHHANNILVRFKAGAPQAARDALHAAAGAVKIKSYRFVDGLSVSRYNEFSCF